VPPQHGCERIFIPPGDELLEQPSVAQFGVRRVIAQAAQVLQELRERLGLHGMTSKGRACPH
jgi:hypothetical protein